MIADIERHKIIERYLAMRGAIKYRTEAGEKIAVVESTHLAGTTVAYSLAPIAVITNPEFRLQGNTKHTLCQYRLGYVDLEAVLAELNAIELG